MMYIAADGRLGGRSKGNSEALSRIRSFLASLLSYCNHASP